jgi:hypothetical protein
MSQLSEEDDLAMAINAHIESNQAAEAAFGFASPSLLAKLNNSFRTVTQPAPNLPGVEVSYFVQAVFDPESLTELLKIKEQIVQLDLSYMPVKDEHLEIIGNFANLQHLSLNFTEIDGSGLIYLVGNEKLSKLSLAGTLVSEEALRPLEQPMHVYLWNTKVTSIPPGNVNMTGYFGYNVDQEDPIALTPPEVANKRSVVKKDERIVLKHNVPGVQISYRLDTEKPQISDEYTGPIPFEDFVTVTAVAYKEGWLESPEIKRTIYKESLPIDSITIIQAPNPKFTGLGAPSLVDSETGDISDFSSGNWLGYREKPLEIWLKTSVPVRKVILSYGVNINSYIMPPWRVEVWSSSDGRQFTRLDSKVPAQPVEYEKSHTANESFELTGSGPFYKVIAYPVPELPAWHNGKGEKGWVFVDELYLY